MRELPRGARAVLREDRDVHLQRRRPGERRRHVRRLFGDDRGDEAFVLKIAEKKNLAATAPLLCAGITTYSPLRRWKVSKGQKVGVVGLGGLGHMAVKFANAFGAHVALFTTTPNKAEDARRFGAHEVIISKDKDARAKHTATFDFILDTVSAEHDLNAY